MRLSAITLVALCACGRLGFDETAPGTPDGGVLPIGRWAQISVGDGASCGITQTGELWCWGFGFGGAVGNGRSDGVFQPTMISAGWRSVAMRFHGCGIQTDDSLWCWGHNKRGSLGLGMQEMTVPSPTRIGAASWLAVGVGMTFSCGLQKDGALFCWGAKDDGQLGNGLGNDLGTPTRIGGDTWSSLSVGYNYACAIKPDSTLWCWGYNNNGQLGDNSSQQRDTPRQVAIGTNWKTVVAGQVHTCALDDQNAVWCWGANYNGMLGSGDYLNSQVPRRVSMVASALAVGANHTCMLDSGSVICWGGTFRAQFALETDNDILTPTRITTTAATAISANGYNTCLIDVEGHLFCVGANSYGETGQPAGEVHTPTQLDTRTDWIDIYAGRRHTCAQAPDGTWCWGDGDAGQNGDGANLDRQTPVRVSISKSFSQLALGEAATAGKAVGLANDGVWLWGFQFDGSYANTPQQVSMTTTLSVALGDGHGCRVVGNALSCAGRNKFGQLGDGSTNDSTVEVTVSGMWQYVAAGYNSTCGIDAAGMVRCWGYNGTGQLGDGTTNDSSLPRDTGLGASQTVVMGLDSTCALSNGRIFCWGSGGQGQLGTGMPSGSPTPVQVGTRTDWRKLAAGDWHVCAIANDDTLWCWGHGDEGQTGDPALVQHNAPHQVPGAWKDVAGGDHFTCALKTDGTRYCFGGNSDGQLGNQAAWQTAFLAVP